MGNKNLTYIRRLQCFSSQVSWVGTLTSLININIFDAFELATPMANYINKNDCNKEMLRQAYYN